MTPEERASRGARYREFLQSGEVTEALEAIEAQYAGAWADCFDVAERENLWRFVRVTRKIREHFGQVASSGRLASHQLTEAKRLSK